MLFWHIMRCLCTGSCMELCVLIIYTLCVIPVLVSQVIDMLLWCLDLLGTEALHENLADLTCDISIKEKLVEELEMSQKRLQAMRTQYEEKLTTLEFRIKQTEVERDKVLSNLSTFSSQISLIIFSIY